MSAFTRIFYASPVPTAVSRVEDGLIIEVNGSFEKLLGYTREELIGHTSTELSFWLDPEVRPSLTRKFLRDGSLRNVHVSLRTGRGDIRETIASSEKFRFDGVDCLISSFADITDMKRFEAVLSESEERYRSIVENAHDGIFILDEDRRIIFVNRQLTTIVGYAAEEMLGRYPDEFLVAPFHKIARRIFKKESRTDDFRAHVSFQYIHKSGEVRYGETRTSTYRTSQGRYHMVTQLLDITDFVKATEALRESEERYHNIADLVYNWIWEVDAEGRLTYVSPKTEEHTGYTPQEVLGKSVEDFTTPEEGERIAPFVARIFRERRPFINLEYTSLHKDGREMVVECCGMPLFDGNGEFRGFRGVHRDITERRRAEEALRRHEAELQRRAEHLEEANLALRALMRRREMDRAERKEMIEEHLDEMIKPYLNKLRRSPLDKEQAAWLATLEENLWELAAPLVDSTRSKYIGFTHKEMQVARMIRDGHTTRDIARIMGVSLDAIELHRNHIRAKLGLKGKPINLQAFLLGLP